MSIVLLVVRGEVELAVCDVDVATVIGACCVELPLEGGRVDVGGVVAGKSLSDGGCRCS